MIETLNVFNIITENGKPALNVYATTAKEKDSWTKALVDAFSSTQLEDSLKNYEKISKDLSDHKHEKRYRTQTAMDLAGHEVSATLAKMRRSRSQTVGV
jgi:hypothetical protein